MIETNQIAVRLSPADLAVLDALLARTGIANATDVVRLALRRLAAAEGIDVATLKPLATRAQLEARNAKRTKRKPAVKPAEG